MDVMIGFCGVCCDHCGTRRRIPEMAAKLKRFIEAYGYGEWVGNFTKDFDFDDLMRGLDWFADSDCIACHEGGGMPRCELRTCCLKRGLRNCYFCEKFPECGKLNYQKETYRVGEHYERIRQVGYENWMREQDEKTKEDFDNIEYLEKRRDKYPKY